ncbi:MAG: hypothetical protein KC441_15140 [Anaerolineales bacterium]|nr:hypothetical protein [Anaerolineales bacterium]
MLAAQRRGSGSFTSFRSINQIDRLTPADAGVDGPAGEVVEFVSCIIVTGFTLGETAVAW